MNRAPSNKINQNRVNEIRLAAMLETFASVLCLLAAPIFL